MTFDASPQRVRRYVSSPEAARTDQARAVIVFAQVAVCDRASGARRMNEAAAAGVHAHVIDAARVDVEEDEIAGRELGERHRPRRTVLLARRAGNCDAGALMHVEREPAAIETCGVRAAEVIRRADERDRERGYLAARVGRRRPAWLAGAAGEQQRCNSEGPRGKRAGRPGYQRARAGLRSGGGAARAGDRRASA